MKRIFSIRSRTKVCNVNDNDKNEHEEQCGIVTKIDVDDNNNTNDHENNDSGDDAQASSNDITSDTNETQINEDIPKDETRQKVTEEQIVKLELIEEENEAQALICDDFEVGDHIYSFASLGTYQHHGIIIAITNVMVTVVYFSIMTEGMKQQEGNSFEEEGISILSLEQWRIKYGKPRKVHYSISKLHRFSRISGTCTLTNSDPSFLVISRIRFLLEFEHLIPSFHMLHSNSENVAVWCKTGRWSTLQVSDFLHLTAAGQVKSAGTLGVYVSNHTVLVPSSGLWGYLGYTTKISLATAQPYLLPLIAGYGIITMACPMYMLRKCRCKWNETTNVLNDEFWTNYATPDVFVDCIKYWSSGIG